MASTRSRIYGSNQTISACRISLHSGMDPYMSDGSLPHRTRSFSLGLIDSAGSLQGASHVDQPRQWPGTHVQPRGVCRQCPATQLACGCGGRTQRPGRQVYSRPSQRWYPFVQVCPGPGGGPMTSACGAGGAIRTYTTACAGSADTPNRPAKASAQRRGRYFCIMSSLMRTDGSEAEAA